MIKEKDLVNLGFKKTKVSKEESGAANMPKEAFNYIWDSGEWKCYVKTI